MPHGPAHPRAFTLIEAMLLLVIVGIVSVAAGVGLQAVAKVPESTELTLAVDNALVDQMEQWTAKSWATMNPSSPYSSPYSTTAQVIIEGHAYSRTITVADADPSNPESGSSKKTDFRRISITLTPTAGGTTQSMVSYVTNP